MPQQSLAQEEGEFAKELREANISVYQDAERAVELSTYVYKNAKHKNTKIVALVTLVNGYTALNQNGEALEYATKTLELAESSGNVQYQIWALGLLGEQYQLSHLNEISREYLDRADALIQNSNLPKEVMAVSRGNIFAIKGNGYKDEIDCDYAIKNYDLAINSYKVISDNSVAKNNLALVFLEKGNCLLELDNLDLAEKNFHLALDIAEQNQLEEYMQKATLGLSKIDTRKGKYEISKNSLEELLKTIDTTLHPRLKNELYLLLKENYLSLGNLDKYRFYDNKYESSSQDISTLEKDQFQQVLQFVERQPGSKSESFGWKEILLYGLYGFAVVIIFREVFKRIKRK
ncbi:MAG: hypothetical protein ACTIJ9_07510 [Aequorivita sp.]